jgi:hypothetical protein
VRASLLANDAPGASEDEALIHDSCQEIMKIHGVLQYASGSVRFGVTAF